MTKPRSWPEAHRSNKLSLAQMLAIKSDDRKHAQIAKDHGVSRSYVCQIKNGTRMKTAFGLLDLVLGVSPQEAVLALL